MWQNICIFGNSIGYGVSDYEKWWWVARLRSYLEQKEYDGYIYNCSISGIDTNNILTRFSHECGVRKGKIIIFATGTNDSLYFGSKDKPNTFLDVFQSNIQELIRQARAFTDTIIFVWLTPIDQFLTRPIPWRTTKYYDEENITSYDSSIRNICIEQSLLYIPMLDVIEKTDLCDGIHPNAIGHEKMFQRIKDFLISHNIL